MKEDKKLGLFDFINSITLDKVNLFELEDAEELYEPFFVNRGLSYYVDTIHYADVMNRSTGLTNKMQYDFLFLNIPKKKRFSKWAKVSEISDDLNNICKKYDCSVKTAIEYHALFTEEELKALREENIKGGIGNEARRKD